MGHTENPPFILDGPGHGSQLAGFHVRGLKARELSMVLKGGTRLCLYWCYCSLIS